MVATLKFIIRVVMRLMQLINWPSYWIDMGKMVDGVDCVAPMIAAVLWS